MRRKRTDERRAAIDMLLESASRVYGDKIESEEALYKLCVDDENYDKFKPLFDEFFAYSNDGKTGLIPQAMGQITKLADLYVEPTEFETSYERYQSIQLPLPEYLVTMTDFVYPRPRTVKEDEAFMVMPVNIFAAAGLIGKKASDTVLPLMYGDLRGSIANPDIHSHHSLGDPHVDDKTITYVAYPFILDRDTSAIAQFMRYLKNENKTMSNLQHANQSALVCEGVGGFVSDGYVIFNRAVFDNRYKSPSIGRDLRFEEPPYIKWIRSPVEGDTLCMAFSTVAGAQQRSIEERMYIIAIQDLNEVVGGFARPVYEDAVRAFYRDTAGNKGLSTAEKYRLLGESYIREANSLRLGASREEALILRERRVRLISELGWQIKESELQLNTLKMRGADASQIRMCQKEIDSMSLVLVQFANAFSLYHAKKIEGKIDDNCAPVNQEDDYFYRISRKNGHLYWQAVTPQFTIGERRGVVSCMRSSWLEIKDKKGVLNWSLWEAGKPFRIEKGRWLILGPEFNQQTVEAIVPASVDKFIDEYLYTGKDSIENKVKKQIRADGELLILWPDVVAELDQWQDEGNTKQRSRGLITDRFTLGVGNELCAQLKRIHTIIGKRSYEELAQDAKSCQAIEKILQEPWVSKETLAQLNVLDVFARNLNKDHLGKLKGKAEETLKVDIRKRMNEAKEENARATAQEAAALEAGLPSPPAAVSTITAAEVVPVVPAHPLQFDWSGVRKEQLATIEDIVICVCAGLKKAGYDEAANPAFISDIMGELIAKHWFDPPAIKPGSDSAEEIDLHARLDRFARTAVEVFLLYKELFQYAVQHPEEDNYVFYLMHNPHDLGSYLPGAEGVAAGSRKDFTEIVAAVVPQDWIVHAESMRHEILFITSPQEQVKADISLTFDLRRIWKASRRFLANVETESGYFKKLQMYGFKFTRDVASAGDVLRYNIDQLAGSYKTHRPLFETKPKVRVFKPVVKDGRVALTEVLASFVQAKVLVVESEANMHAGYQDLVQRICDASKIQCVKTSEEAIGVVSQMAETAFVPDVLLINMHPADGSMAKLSNLAQQLNKNVVVVVITDPVVRHADIFDAATGSNKFGDASFLPRPVVESSLAGVIERCRLCKAGGLFFQQLPTHDPAKPRPGFNEADVVKEATEIIASRRIDDLGFWTKIGADHLWVRRAARYYERIGQADKARRLIENAKSGHVRAGEMITAYGANINVGGQDWVLIATNDNRFPVETLIHETNLGTHAENLAAEEAFKKDFSVFVSGGAGLVASFCNRRLIEKGYKVIIYDNLGQGNRELLPEGVVFIEGDLADTKKLQDAIVEHNCGYIMNFAASIEVGESRTNPAKYFYNNTVNTINLIETACQAGIRRFIHSSTAAVYGEPERVPIVETDPLNANNAYGESKLMIERAMEYYENAIRNALCQVPLL